MKRRKRTTFAPFVSEESLDTEIQYIYVRKWTSMVSLSRRYSGVKPHVPAALAP